MRKVIAVACLLLGVAASVATFGAFGAEELFRQPLLFLAPLVAAAAVCVLSGLALARR